MAEEMRDDVMEQIQVRTTHLKFSQGIRGVGMNVLVMLHLSSCSPTLQLRSWWIPKC